MTTEPENYDPPYGPVDPGRWQVHLAVAADESQAIEKAAPTVLPAERVWVNAGSTEPGAEAEDLTLVMLIFAETHEKAVERALYDYGRIRVAAGLDAQQGTVLGYQSPWWRDGRRVADLGREAHQLHKDKRHELAVIRIQTACEIHTLNTFTQVQSEEQREAFKAIRFNPSLMDKQSKALLQLVTGARIQDESWWPEYCTHVQRRNSIVHEGLEVDSVGASASLTVTLELQRWLTEARSATVAADPEDDPAA